MYPVVALDPACYTYLPVLPVSELEGVIKGKGWLFPIADLSNETILGTFHFYSIALLKLGFRPGLSAQVDTELRRIRAIINQGD